MEVQTPYFYIEKSALEKNFEKLVAALERYWNNYIIGYSYKTNAIPWVIQYFQNKGCYSEVVSEDEYLLSKKIKRVEKHCIYNGPIKTKETFLEALEKGCIVNIDSQREISWLNELKDSQRYSVGIRVNFDIEKNCPRQSACGSEGGRFGFCYENGELEKAINLIQRTGVHLSGIHLHTSSKTRSLSIYETIADVACEVGKRYHLELDYIDIGGGFFGGLENKPQFDEYLERISSRLLKVYDSNKTKLIIEPGMCLIGGFVKYVTQVIDVKDTSYNRFVITDGSRIHIDPLMTKNSYFYEIETQKQHLEEKEKQVICGFTCMEPDRLMVLENKKELVVGDKIIYDKVGAYTMCLSPLFISYFPDVYVKEEKDFQKIRKRWTSKEYMQNCFWDGKV